MVTELMPNGDLFRALASSAGKQQLSWYRQGKFVALDIAKGLFYLHSNNVVHLDIKVRTPRPNACIRPQCRTSSGSMS